MKKVQTLLLTAGVLTVLIGNGPIPASAQQQPLLGCVKPGTGLLRILPAGEECKHNETPLGFNDLPLLVGLQNRISDLEETVQNLTERVEELEACLPTGSECGAE
jgi:hypothetical protein